MSDEERGMRENGTVCMNVYIYLKTVNLITCQRNEKKKKEADENKTEGKIDSSFVFWFYFALSLSLVL